jgi:hypothetical protein
MVVQAYNPYSLGIRGRRIVAQSWLDKRMRLYRENKLKAKGLGTWLKW